MACVEVAGLGLPLEAEAQPPLVVFLRSLGSFAGGSPGAFGAPLYPGF